MPDPHATRRKLAHARLYVLTDARGSRGELGRWARMLVEAGVDVIQLRDKSLSDRELLESARVLRAATRGGRALMIINDRPDVARLAHADGVHVGQDELPAEDVRRIVGQGMLVGVSTHTLGEACAAAVARADYIGCGPTFASRTKSFARFPGLDLLRCVHAEIDLPAFAIGGITADNVSQVLATGFRRIAVSHAVTGAADPAAAVRRLREALDK